MAFTDNCDLFGSVHEEGINRVVRHVMRQRPSLFNYGTAWVAADPRRLCVPINPHPSVLARNNPLITIEDPLPILGTDGAFGLNFCAQLSKFEIDFHPGNVVTLPPELAPPLGAQRLAFRVQVCGGIGCPGKDFFDRFEPPPPPGGGFIPGKDKEPNRPDDKQPKPPPAPIPTDKLECFCLDLFVVGHMEVVPGGAKQKLVAKVDGLEIVDIKPPGLENSLECYLRVLIHFIILPRLKVDIPKFVFDILDIASYTLSAVPVSAAVPNNPSVANDQLKVFIKFEVTP